MLLPHAEAGSMLGGRGCGGVVSVLVSCWRGCGGVVSVWVSGGEAGRMLGGRGCGGVVR